MSRILNYIGVDQNGMYYPSSIPQIQTTYHPAALGNPAATGMRGALTYFAEGVDDPKSRYFTGRLHHPSSNSGVTIGRGYDMKERTTQQVYDDMMDAGLEPYIAAAYAKGAGLSGSDAEKFIAQNSALPFLPASVEQNLFSTEYDRMLADVMRICTKTDVVQKYGSTDWENLNPAIQELLVDLRYRGDYTPKTRLSIQEAVANNDLESLAATMSDRNTWASVPQDRFDRRASFMQSALESELNNLSDSSSTEIESSQLAYDMCLNEELI